ncbi:MAG: helix-turn-helix domain-containing protein, partial [Clostridiales bacterium]|nr:helix-turn-helix domain-containing protein [Clostridiales bacterium]
PLENRLASYILASYTNEDNNNTENLTQIAEFLGTSYRHLLRVVKEFELEKIIKRDNKKLVILDKDKLEDLAGDLYQ